MSAPEIGSKALDESNGTVTSHGGLTWTRLSDFEMRPVRFLDKPFLQADTFHLIAGRKGEGKSTWLAHNAARATRGELGSKSQVIYIASEDSPEMDTKPRIVAAAGNPDNVIVVTEWVQFPRDLDAIIDLIRELGDVGMLVIDPVGNHIAGKKSDSETDIRDAIGRLNQIADEEKCMVFGVRHITEKTATDVTKAILGSSAWVQLPRVVIALVRDPEEPDVVHVKCTRSNRLPPDTPGRKYRIEPVKVHGLENEVTRAVPLGESTKDLESMLSASDNREPSKTKKACDRIIEILTREGEQPSKPLFKRVAEETDLAPKTVSNAVTKLQKDSLIAFRRENHEDGTFKQYFVRLATDDEERF